MYIAIEGTDGTGKSTQVNALRNWLKEEFNFSVFDVHDPDLNFPVSKSIRDLWRVDNKTLNKDNWALLFSVSSIVGQNYHNGVIENLKVYDVVISDRSGLSNYAYFWDSNLIERLDDLHKTYIKPDLTIYIEIDSKVIHKRLNSRPNENSPGINSINELKKNYKKSINHLSTIGWNIIIYTPSLNESIFNSTENLKKIILPYLNKYKDNSITKK